MIDEADTDSPAEGMEKIWECNRRLRQAELETTDAHAQQLAERYGGDRRTAAFRRRRPRQHKAAPAAIATSLRQVAFASPDPPRSRSDHFVMPRS